MIGTDTSRALGETHQHSFQRYLMPFDLTTDMAIDNNGAGFNNITVNGYDSFTFNVSDNSSNLNYRHSANGVFNLGSILTQEDHVGVEISFKCDAGNTGIDFTTPSYSSYWERCIRAAISFGENPFKSASDGGGVNYFTDQLNDGKGKVVAVDFLRYWWNDNFLVSVGDELGELNVGSDTSTGGTRVTSINRATSKDPSYRDFDFDNDFDGAKEIKIRFYFSKTHRLFVDVLVGSNLVGCYSSHFRVLPEIYRNKDIYIHMQNFVGYISSKSKDIDFTEFKVGRLVSGDLPTKLPLTSLDQSSKRVKAYRASDLYESGVPMKTLADYKNIFKTILVGDGYNGVGGCNWDLVYENDNTSAVRAKSGVRDFYQIRFKHYETSGLWDNSWINVSVVAYESMSGIDTGTNLLSHDPNIHDGDHFYFLLPHVGENRFAGTNLMEKGYLSPHMELFLPLHDWMIVASDKTLFSVIIGHSRNSSNNGVNAGSCWAFGEYETAIKDNPKASFILSSSADGDWTHQEVYGGLRWNGMMDATQALPRRSMFITRDFNGFKPTYLCQGGSYYRPATQENSMGINSSLIGAPRLTPTTISHYHASYTGADFDGWLSQLFAVQNAFGTNTDAKPFDRDEMFTEGSPSLTEFTIDSKSYIYFWSGCVLGSNTAVAQGMKYTSAGAISLADEDWP